MSITYVYGIRAVAGVSLLSALTMMFITTYVFIARVEDLLSSKFPAAGVPLNISSSHKDPHENYQYEKLLQLINDLWIKYRSVLVSSSMLAILAGLLQSIFCGLVLLADTKSLRIYVRKWVTVHFILVFLLFIILLNTIVLAEHSADKSAWLWAIHMLKYDLSRERPLNDYTDLYLFLGVNQQLIYIGVGINLPMILILMGAMLYCMKSLQDYEAYE